MSFCYPFREDGNSLSLLEKKRWLLRIVFTWPSNWSWHHPGVDPSWLLSQQSIPRRQTRTQMSTCRYGLQAPRTPRIPSACSYKGPSRLNQVLMTAEKKSSITNTPAKNSVQTHTSDIDAYLVALMSIDLLFVNIKLVFKMPSGSIQLKRKRL